jgi:serine/threonine-protein kinase
MPPATRVFANRYELGEEIGHGGMADVYLAHDRLLDRPVAVKVLSAQSASDPTNVERFRREAQSAAGLNHHNIVAVYDWGEEHDTSFIVMEYVPGQTLRDILREYGRLTPVDAARITAEIADALSFAHAHGVVHRDVKPGNVLVTPQGDVKVTDFGIARADTSEPLTKTGAVLGTATYFSPEQAQGFALDGRSDVYALGVVLYEMLTGAAPFSASSPVSVAYKHVREVPAPPSSVVPDLPGAMDRIVLTAMAKDVDARYQSAQDLRADLLRFERGRPLQGAGVIEEPTAPASVLVAAPVARVVPVTAAPPTAPEPAPERPGGRWGPIVAVALAMMLLVGLIVVLLAGSNFGDDGGPGVPDVPVPGVVGVPFTQADQTLQGVKFVVVRRDEERPDQAADLVVGQSPEEGTKLKQGGAVTLTVSAANIAVPNVVGKNRAQATADLAAKSLVGNFVEEDSAQPPGTVLRTDPAAGAPVAKLPNNARPTVTVVVAKEPPIPVPDVSQQSPLAAAATLGQAGFQVTQVNTPSATVAVGSVIGTDPPAGTPVARGGEVKLLISTGPEMVDVPNMVGQTRAMAEQVLNAQLGFGIQITLVKGTPAQVGKVTAQAPSSGKAAKGSTIAISVGE